MTSLNPQTTPRHQLRAEKARRNKEAALAAFRQEGEIDATARPPAGAQRRSFQLTHPDEVGWAMVGTLEHYNGLLKRITDSAFGEGEYAK